MALFNDERMALLMQGNAGINKVKKYPSERVREQMYRFDIY
jgi:hypothetical protein